MKLPEANLENQTGNASPGTYWKHGMGKKPVQVKIEARIVREGNEPGPCAGSFANTVDMPFNLDGRPFTLTLSTKSKGYRELLQNLGPDSDKWIGATILITDDPVLANGINVAYIGGP